MDEDPDVPWTRSDEIQFWIRRIVAIIGFGMPVVAMVIAFLGGSSRDEILWTGIMFFILGMIFMYGTTPRSFSLFPPGRRPRSRR